MTWRSIKDDPPPKAAPFIALNHDLEVWVAKYIDGRIAFRTNCRFEPRTYLHKTMADGSVGLVLDGSMEDNYAKDTWRNDWTFWSRLYDFKPTHWMPLPEPPKTPNIGK